MDSSGGYVVAGSEKELTTFNDWLQCYMQDGMKNLVDRNGSKYHFWIGLADFQAITKTNLRYRDDLV